MEIDKIYLGDAYELIKKVESASVDCVYTDIPYKMEKLGGGFLAKQEGTSQTFGRDIAKFIDGVKPELWDEIDRIMKKTNLFVWCSKEQIPFLIDRYVSKKGLNYQILVWCKTNSTPFCSNNWIPNVEYCLWFSDGAKLNDGWELKSKWFVSPTNGADKKDFKHPTIKPLEMVKRHLLHATQPNDLVFDPFMGSGTTAVASAETGRHYLGFEIDPSYHKIAVDRLDGVNVRGQLSLFAPKSEQINLFGEGENNGK